MIDNILKALENAYQELTEEEHAILTAHGITEENYNTMIKLCVMFGQGDVYEIARKNLSAMSPDAVYVPMVKKSVENILDQIRSRPKQIKLPTEIVEDIYMPCTKLDRQKTWRMNKIEWRQHKTYRGYEVFVGTEKNAYRKRESDIGVYAVYTFDYDIGLSVFDKMVYCVIYTLCRTTNNNIVSYKQIHRMLGYKGTPNKFDIEKYTDSVRRLEGTRITIDNEAEVIAGLKSYGKIRDIVSKRIMNVNYHVLDGFGKLVPAIEIINGDFALFEFAERHNKQIFSVPVKVLAVPGGQRTDTRLQITDYCLMRTADITGKTKVKANNNKILFDTVRRECRIEDAEYKLHKGRYEKYVIDTIKHFKDEGWIKSFAIKEDGVLIGK